MSNLAVDRLNQLQFDELRSMRLSVTQVRRLLAYRDQHGEFRSLDELDGLAGFSHASIKDLKETLIGAKPASPEWAAPAPAPAKHSSEHPVAGTPVTARRRRPQRDGLLLFVGFLAATAVVLGLAFTAYVGPPVLSGASMAVLGVGIVVAYREVAEVRASLDLIRFRTLQRVLALIAGASLVALGIARIVG